MASTRLMCRLVACALLFLFAAAATAAMAATQAHDERSQGRIAVSLKQDETFDILVLDPSGASRRLTRDAADDTAPVWSPDGRTIAFVSTTRPDAAGGLAGMYTTATLCVFDADSGHVTPLTSFGPRLEPRIGRPAWSPDGRTLAFAYGGIGVGPADIHLVEADGSNLRKLTGSEEYADHGPCWSPDGRRIVFDGRRTGGATDGLVAQVYLVDADGGTPQRLVQGEAPAWLSDGRRVGFVVRSGSILAGDSSAQLRLVDTQTFDVRNVGPPFTTIGCFRWSPDDLGVAVVGRREHRNEDLNAFELQLRSTQFLHLLDGDAFEPRRLHVWPADDGVLGWSPDGARLCMASRRGEDLTFWTVDRAGGRKELKLPGATVGARCDWGPAPGLAAPDVSGTWTGEVRILDRLFSIDLVIGEREGRPYLVRAVGPQVPGSFDGPLDEAGGVLRRSIALAIDAASGSNERHYATWALRVTASGRMDLEQRISPDRPRHDGPAFPVYDLRRVSSETVRR